MIIQLPNFKDGAPVWNSEPFDIDVADYAVEINSIQDYKDKILSKVEVPSIESYNQLKEDIDKATNKNLILPMLTENRKQFERRVKLILFDYDEVTKEKYEEQIKKAIEYIKSTNSASSKFIIKNNNEIKNVIDEFQHNIKQKLKENRKVVNKKYYEKRKQELNIPSARTKLTEEQKRENKRLANQKYRDAQKQLNNKEVVEVEEENVITPTEKRKIYNQTYYQKQKTLKEKIKLLENEIAQLKKEN